MWPDALSALQGFTKTLHLTDDGPWAGRNHPPVRTLLLFRSHARIPPNLPAHWSVKIQRVPSNGRDSIASHCPCSPCHFSWLRSFGPAALRSRGRTLFSLVTLASWRLDNVGLGLEQLTAIRSSVFPHIANHEERRRQDQPLDEPAQEPRHKCVENAVVLPRGLHRCRLLLTPMR